MRRILPIAALLVTVALIAGCGKTVDVKEANLSVRAAPPATRTPQQGVTTPPGTPSSGKVRIAVVTHGEASDPFWSTVRTGINQGAHQMNASVTYAAPDTYDPARERQLIEQAIARRPNGLVVTIPNARVVGPAITSAVKAGIPVISINSGTDVANRLGVLVHIGQRDEQAGVEAGQRFAASGVKRAICVNQEAGNSGLDQRCAGFAAAMRKAHATSTNVAVSLQDQVGSERKISAAIRSNHADGVMALGPTSAEPALNAIRAEGQLGKIKIATFDLSPDVVSAVKQGNIEFAVDQQPFLEGYLSVLFLAQYQRYGVLPDKGRVVETGPSFVTPKNADVVSRLADQGIR